MCNQIQRADGFWIRPDFLPEYTAIRSSDTIENQREKITCQVEAYRSTSIEGSVTLREPQISARVSKAAGELTHRINGRPDPLALPSPIVREPSIHPVEYVVTTPTQGASPTQYRPHRSADGWIILEPF